MFGDAILGRLSQRPLSGRGEERLRLTVVCLIRTFSFHRLRRNSKELADTGQRHTKSGSNFTRAISYRSSRTSYHPYHRAKLSRDRQPTP